MKELIFELTYWTVSEQELAKTQVHALASTKEDSLSILNKLFQPALVKQDDVYKMRHVVEVKILDGQGLL